MYHGDLNLGDTLDFKFTSRKFSTGAPFTLAGTPAVSAYVDNGTTEITAGITLTVDFDSRTGLNHVRIVATSGNGYAAGTNVDLVITAGTVDSVSVVGEVIGSFSIEKRSALRPTTGGRTLDVTATGAAGVDWGNVENPTTTLNLSGTSVKTATDVETDTQDIQSRLPAALTGAGNLKADAQVVSDKTGYGLADDAITAAKFDESTAFPLTSADTGSSAVARTGADGDTLKTLSDQIDAVPTAAATADAVWDEPLAGHLGAGSTGAALNAAGSAGDPWATSLPGAYGAGTAGKIIGDNVNATISSRAAQTTADNIEADTQDLQSRVPAALVSGRMASDAVAISGSTAAADAVEANIGNLNAPVATVDTVVDAIKAKTDSLTFTVAGQVDANVQSLNDTTLTGDGSSGNKWGPA